VGIQLVMGGSGFLGSHVVRQLVAHGVQVRVWTRPSSSTRAFDDLPVEHIASELDDEPTLRAAMRDVDAVHYCVVDTRAWLRDPAPLFATNVDGLRHALDAAVAAGVPRFVFCSTVGTIAIVGSGLADESMPHNWEHLGGGYIRSRLTAERLVLRYHSQYGLPAVVLCVATTYGPHDYGPSPHGGQIAAAARGKLPVYLKGQLLEVVSVEDAARAFPLAAERGRPGERYIISERWLPAKDLLDAAAAEVGRTPPRWGVPLALMKVIGVAGDLAGRMLRRDVVLNSTSVRLAHIMSPLDHGKAVRELGWEPGPTLDAVRDAARFFTAPSGYGE
jgi:dihydroflavonol-4-reductase